VDRRRHLEHATRRRWRDGERPATADDFSISANPNSLTVQPGRLGKQAPSRRASRRGNPQSVTLSSSGCPSGASCTFGTNPIRSGGSSTLTVGAGNGPAGLSLAKTRPEAGRWADRHVHRRGSLVTTLPWQNPFAERVIGTLRVSFSTM